MISNASDSTEQSIEKLIPFLFPNEWFNTNPDYLNYFPIPKESVSTQIIRQQIQLVGNWSGSCNTISNISQPNLIIVGTDDDDGPLQDSLTLATAIIVRRSTNFSGICLLTSYP